MIARGLTFLTIGLAIAATAAAEQPPNLLDNGDFKQIKDGWPVHWERQEGMSYHPEEGGFIRFSARPGAVMSYRVLSLPANAQQVRLVYEVRHQGIEPGPEGYHDARFVLHFLDVAGRELHPGPPHPNFRGTSDGWIREERMLDVLPQARSMVVMPAMFHAQAGTWDIRRIVITAVTGERTAGPPTQLRVEGRRLLNEAGDPVWLQGVNIPSLEWSNQGEQVLRSTEVAIRDWNANVIRLPLSQDRWFGRAPEQTDGGEQYRKIVDEVLDYCVRHGVYLVIDLHWSNAGHWGQYMSQHNMPDEHSRTFWIDVANRYKNHPAVLFDLYNEPRDVSWEIWRNGGWVADSDHYGTKVSYQGVGMQQLVDAIRQTGANNVIVAGGLDWAYDLTGILKGYALNDHPGGFGIMYKSHIYPWKRDWDAKVLAVAKQYPVLIGEVGCEPDKAQESPYTWGPDMIAYIQKHRLHWTAWCFHPSASPRMLQDWDYTPTPYWGGFVKAALLGARFELNRSR